MIMEKSLQRVRGEELRKCPDCGSKDLIREQGEVYCKKCGLVVE